MSGSTERQRASAGMLHMGLCDTLLIRHLVDPARNKVFTWTRDCSCKNDDCSCWEYVSQREATEDDLEQYKMASFAHEGRPPVPGENVDVLAGLNEKWMRPRPGYAGPLFYARNEEERRHWSEAGEDIPG